ncbi:MAG: hypothetical protein ACR5LH_07830, partial [Sodalis sp. (in: enterobacteria)]
MILSRTVPDASSKPYKAKWQKAKWWVLKNLMAARALLNKSELADRMALYYTCYPILTLCGIPNNVIRFSALTIA